MTTIQLTFPWGRYYAHPWGINPVRLREAEWPPSPWRLLRALVAAWFRRHPGIAPSVDAIALIEKLGGTLPKIGMGKIAFGHTVHYQPNFGETNTGKEEERIGRLEHGVYKKTRHENHFVAVHGPVLFHWPELELAPAQAALLAELLAEISYFGRSESLCHAELLAGNSSAPSVGWCKSVSASGNRKISSQCRDVFCAKPQDFQITDLWARRDAKLKADDSSAPQHLVDALLSADMKVDGAAWVSYEMPVGWPEKWVIRVPRTAKATTKPLPSVGPKVAHYLCFSLQCRVPLLPKFIVPLTERFREAANHHLCKVHGDGVSSFAILGHAKDRPENVEGDHQHAFYMPMRAQGEREGFLRDLHVWCPLGFTQAEVDVFLRISRLNWGGGKYPVRPVLTALSKEPPSDACFATGRTASRIWRSASPFVPPRYFYRRSGNKMTLKEKDRPERQLAECLKAAGVTTAGEIRRIAPPDSSPTAGQSQWDVVRTPETEEVTSPDATNVTVHRNSSDGARSKERRVGLFFEIEFVEPVALPLPAFGHSCHFGLGLFVPA
jgi:CRISPR-associated protein Csb2